MTGYSHVMFLNSFQKQKRFNKTWGLQVPFSVKLCDLICYNFFPAVTLYCWLNLYLLLREKSFILHGYMHLTALSRMLAQVSSASRMVQFVGYIGNHLLGNSLATVLIIRNALLCYILEVCSNVGASITVAELGQLEKKSAARKDNSCNKLRYSKLHSFSCKEAWSPDVCRMKGKWHPCYIQTIDIQAQLSLKVESCCIWACIFVSQISFQYLSTLEPLSTLSLYNPRTSSSVLYSSSFWLRLQHIWDLINPFGLRNKCSWELGLVLLRGSDILLNSSQCAKCDITMVQKGEGCFTSPGKPLCFFLLCPLGSRSQHGISPEVHKQFLSLAGPLVSCSVLLQFL